MLDLLERQWHTATIAAAVTGQEMDDWGTLKEKFDAYLSGKEVAVSKEEEMRGLLGLSPR